MIKALAVLEKSRADRRDTEPTDETSNRPKLLHQIPDAMSKLFFCCLILAGSFSSLRSLPIIVPSKGSLRLTETSMDFGDSKSWDDTRLLQNLPVLLEKEVERDTDDIFSKEGFGLDAFNIDDSIREELFDKHPRIPLLSRLQSKDRKQYKKRAGNLSECFWKYCV